MNKADFMEGIHILQNNYNKKLTIDQLKLFYESLKDMEKNTFIANIKEQIKNNPYMPNIAQIRNEQKPQFINYEQRDYSNFDWDSLYANLRKWGKYGTI